MTDYSNWKIKQSDLEQKQEEYTEVAQWCNESGQYHIESVGEYYTVVENPAPVPPTYDEVKQLRAQAYANEVDCITAHIQRLRDEDPVPEDEIAELIAERNAKVEEIKERYPYPEGEGNESA